MWEHVPSQKEMRGRQTDRHYGHSTKHRSRRVPGGGALSVGITSAHGRVKCSESGDPDMEETVERQAYMEIRN